SIVGIIDQHGSHARFGSDPHSLGAQLAVEPDGDLLSARFGEERELLARGNRKRIRDHPPPRVLKSSDHRRDPMIANQPEIGRQLQRLGTLQVFAGLEFAASDRYFLLYVSGLYMKHFAIGS